MSARGGFKRFRKIVLVLLCVGFAVPVYVMMTQWFTGVKTHDSMAYSLASAETSMLSYNQSESKFSGPKPIDEDLQRVNEKAMHNFSTFIKFNVSEDGKDCRDRRFLVYACRSVCGGWADRQKGITTMFLLAMLTNRTFVIDMPKPCDIGQLLVPNLYDWRACLSVVKGTNSNNIFKMTRMDGAKVTNLNEILKGNKTVYRVISIQTNTIGIDVIRKYNATRVVLPWLSRLTDEEVTGSVLGTLFKQTDTMYKALVGFWREKVGGRKLVCGHIRQKRIDNASVSNVLKFLQNYDTSDNKHAIFVATDTDDTRNKSRDQFSSFISTERKIVHIDKTKAGGADSCEGFFNAIFEQILLSKCDVLVLTRSNFGAMASYMRGYHDNIFLYKYGNHDVLAIRNLSDVQNIYNFK